MATGAIFSARGDGTYDVTFISAGKPLFGTFGPRAVDVAPLVAHSAVVRRLLRSSPSKFKLTSRDPAFLAALPKLGYPVQAGAGRGAGSDAAFELLDQAFDAPVFAVSALAWERLICTI